MNNVGMSAAAAKRAPKAAKPETTRSPAQLKGLEKARAAKKAKREAGGQEAVEPPTQASASVVESLIEQYAERWNKIGSQADADRLQAEIEHAAKTVAPEELLAYAAAPGLRGKLLFLCVSARAEERAATPHGRAAAEDSAPRLQETRRTRSDGGADRRAAPTPLSSARNGRS
jgi:vacuolar-type H+-ATPase subunit E/Vma4